MPRDSDKLYKMETSLRRSQGGHNLSHKYFENIGKNLKQIKVRQMDMNLDKLFRLIRSTTAPFDAIVVSHVTSKVWNERRDSMREKNIDLDTDRVAIFCCEKMNKNEAYAFATLGEAAHFVDLVDQLVGRGMSSRDAIKLAYRNCDRVQSAATTRKIKDSLTK